MSSNSWETESQVSNVRETVVPVVTSSKSPIERIEGQSSNGLVNVARSSPTPVIDLLHGFNQKLPLSQGLPTLLEEIAQFCDSDGLQAMQSICRNFATGPQSLRFSKAFGDHRTLNDLPPELLTIIATHCTKESLQTFRLLGKKFAQVGTPLLCRSTVSVFNTHQSFKKLQAISKNPVVSAGITHLHCVYGDWSHIGCRGDWNKELLLQHCSTCKTDDDDPVRLDQMYQKFLELRDYHTTLRDTKHDAMSLEAAFKSFSHLESVTISNGSGFPHAKDEFNALIESVGVQPYHKGGVTQPFITVLQATSKAGANIKALNTSPISIGFLASDDKLMLSALRDSIRHVERLNISVDLTESYLWYKEFADHDAYDERLGGQMRNRARSKGLLGKFLHEATKLQSLKVDFGTSMKGPRLDMSQKVLSKLLGSVPWPKLKELTILRSGSTMDELLGLIRRHEKTLKGLAMTSNSLAMGSWEDFFDLLREDVQGGRLKLDSIEFHGAFEWFDDDTGTFFSKQLCSYDEGTDSVCSLGRELATYIEDGGINPWDDEPPQETGGMLPLPMGFLGDIANAAGFAGLAGLGGPLGMGMHAGDFGDDILEPFIDID